jgi:hypothetical protein
MEDFVVETVGGSTKTRQHGDSGVSQGNRVRSGPTIVRFKNKMKRDSFLHAVNLFNKNKSATEKLNHGHLGEGDTSNLPIYINPRLTRETKHIMKLTRDMRKEGKIYRAWVYAGKVHVRVKADDRPLPIYNVSDLRTIICNK